MSLTIESKTNEKGNVFHKIGEKDYISSEEAREQYTYHAVVEGIINLHEFALKRGAEYIRSKK